MAEPIKVGDLVMVVRGHACTIDDFGGIPFRVTAIRRLRLSVYCCRRCGTDGIHAGPYYVPHEGAGIPFEWLKRIPPLTEPETVERRDEVTA